MKHLSFYLIVLGVVLLSQPLCAQNYSVGQFYEGHIINADGSTTQGFIIYGAMLDMKMNVVFYTDKTNKKTKKKYSPKDIKGFKVGAEEYRSIKWGAIIKQQVFALVVAKGHVTTYNIAEQGQDGKVEYQMGLQKGDAETIGMLRFLRFAEEMSEYLSDYEELSAKIKNKEKGYRLLEMEAILREYNEWYEANH
jgi:hypothetical protein